MTVFAPKDSLTVAVRPKGLPAGRCAPCAVVLGLVLGIRAGSLGAQTSLSIYRDGRVVVRHTLAQPRERGHSTLTLTLAGLDPAKLSASEVRFRLPVPAGGEAVLTYTVQIDS